MMPGSNYPRRINPILHIAKGDNQVRIPVNEIKRGVYILKINWDGMTIKRKFVITR